MTTDIAARIAAAAQVHAKCPALVSDSVCWTYEELDGRARAVASTLASRGVGPGARVGVMAPHDENAVCAIVGVLYAGAAYVPLDARWPIARRAEVVADAEVNAVLADDVGTADRLLSCRQPVIELAAAQRNPHLWNAVHGHPNSPAYILYTSGSTGRPKGVVQTRVNVAAHADAYRTSILMTTSDRVALVARVSVDASVMDLFGAFLTGACLFAFDPSRGPAISSWLRRSGVTVLHGTPTLLRHVMRHAEKSDLGGLRCVVSGGEELRAADAAAFRGAVPHALVVNGYGPSECTTALQYRVLGADLDTSLPVPLGCALPSVDINVIREDGREAAAGEEGELLLASPWLALGYWRRPQLTEAAFCQYDGRRAYRTGDFVRRRADGSVVFVGRRDSLVKLRGHRVELGEIESRLLSFPGIASAAVTVHRTPGGRSVLAAFVNGIAPSQTDSVRTWLANSLPAEAVPVSIAVLDRMPLTDSGKIDRAALKTQKTPPASPSSACDAALFEVISRELDIANVSERDNFLALGGDSLAAMACADAIGRSLGTAVPGAWFLQTPNLGRLAARMRALPRFEPVKPQPHSNEFPMPARQLRYWERTRADGPPAAFHVLLETTIVGPLDVGLLRAVLRDLPVRHPWLRTGFEMRDCQPVCVVHAHVALQLAVHDCGSQPSGSPDVQLPLDLARPPLVRALLVRFGPERHALRCLWHHLVVDAWSRRRFDLEVYGEYAARKRGSEANGTKSTSLLLSPAEVDPVAPHELDATKAWWKRTLSSMSPLDVHALVGNGRGARAVARVGQTIPAQLTNAAAREDCSKFAVLLAITAVVVAEAVGRERFLLTTDISRRGRAREAIGLFTDVLVLPIDLGGAREWTLVLQQVWLTLVDSIAHAEVPFEWIVRDVLGGTIAAYDQTFPVAFLVDEPDPPRRFGEITVATCEIDLYAPSRDLLLTITDTGAGMEIAAAARTGAPERIRALVNSIAAAMASAATFFGSPLDGSRTVACRHS